MLPQSLFLAHYVQDNATDPDMLHKFIQILLS